VATSKTYERDAKQRSLKLWLAVSVCIAVLPVVPFYLFWDKISSSTGTLALVTGALLWVSWTWWKLASGVANRIRNLPENTEVSTS
jgi:Na+/proline symporter